MLTQDDNITHLLRAAGQGDREAREELIPIVYRELHRMARQFLNRERPDHTLQPTALVNEAYLKLFEGLPVELESRAHFFSIAATQMRRILIDHARRKMAGKREAELRRVTLPDLIKEEPLAPEELIALDEALSRFKLLYPRPGQIVEMRFFCGMTETETAELLDISVSTLKREWGFAKVWLLRELTRS